MNRGSALKWIAALNNTTASFDAAQLGFIAGSKTFRSPLGVLLDFLAPDQFTIGWDGVSHLWHGQQFTIPDEFRRRTKMKTDGSLLDDVHSFPEAAQLITNSFAEI